MLDLSKTQMPPREAKGEVMNEIRTIDAAAATSMSRRHFLHCSACATAAAGTAGAVGFSGIAMAAIPPGREVMKEFPYGAVQLTRGPVKEQFDSIHAHYLALDNDSVLKVFRQAAGLPAPGKDMGGWYDADGFVPGLTLGQWISGLSRLGAATGDRAAHAKSAALVHGFGLVALISMAPILSLMILGLLIRWKEARNA